MINEKPTKLHSTSLSFGPSMVGLFHGAKIQNFLKTKYKKRNEGGQCIFSIAFYVLIINSFVIDFSLHNHVS